MSKSYTWEGDQLQALSFSKVVGFPIDKDVNWTYISRSEDVLDVFWTSYVRSIYVLCLLGLYPKHKLEAMY